MAARVIAVIQQKGGVGKSTTVVELACAWGVHGTHERNVAVLKPNSTTTPSRVLVIDMDAQAGATRKLGLDPDNIAPEQSVMAVLEDPDHSIESSLWREVYPGFGSDIVPAHFDLERTEAELARRYNRPATLRDKLEPILSDYDYVLIDSRPSLGMLTLNALFAAREVLIPVKMTDTECKNGVRQVVSVLADVAEAGHAIEILGALATFHDARKQKVADDLRRYVSENLGVPFLKTVIPDRSHFGNAALEGLPVNVWKPSMDAASSYRWLAAELVRRALEPAHA